MFNRMLIITLMHVCVNMRMPLSWAFFRWAVNLKFSTIKSKINYLGKIIQNICKSSIYSYGTKYCKRHAVLIWHSNKIWMIPPASRLESFEIRNPWKGRSVHLQLDGDINPSKNSWMRKCNIFDCRYISYPLEILEFTLTFEIKISPKLFNSF